MSTEQTRAGNYFVSNYPPFSAWSADAVAGVSAKLASPPAADVPLGLYVHLPFCRKRCDFCYFKVYTDKSSADIRRYLDSLARELALLAETPYLAGRRPSFVYFGGGTPSYLSANQLRELFGALSAVLPFDDAEEIAFECEPGTLQEPKAAALAELGVTRASLGIEHFDPGILERNNRAHRADEILRAYGFLGAAGFDSVNVDLIAGMVGETDATWSECIERTIELLPESVTIYQMEVPFNTTLYDRMREGGEAVAPVADWATKRRWADEGFARLEAYGYRLGSAYTACRDEQASFLYRDSLWRGADMLGIGVSSFSHLGGVHFQNEHEIGTYERRVAAGEAPHLRAYPMDADERLVREFLLQMKLGRVETAFFEEKFGVDPRERFADALARQEADGLVELDGGEIRTTRAGLMQVDGLLPAYFRPEHRTERIS
ncbi:MAG: coproporphyrinogen-III oxidase family protein [Planctomycetota bacterium]|jgi:oxygen-independent coproporphyrinogen-3 oxidase|nr:coproporphyrinogen-III oxidase family protein [Planctomycetota bacterium]MDP6990044.1 coproporphyrinogen-III oxidase family protein [Planctomycetota bacterium]